MAPETKLSWSARISSALRNLRHILVSFLQSLISKFSAPRHKITISPNKQDNAENKCASPPNGPPIITNVVPPPPRAEESYKCRYPKTPWWKSVLEVVAVILLAIYTCETRRTNNLTQSALKISKEQFTKSQALSKQQFDAAQAASAEQFRQDQRPYIWVTSTGMGTLAYFFPKDIPNVDPKKVGQIDWTYHYTNYGKTPAYHVITTSKRMKLGKNGPLEPSYGFSVHKRELQSGGLVPPGKEDFDTVISRPGITSSEFNRLIGIDEGITIDVKIKYTDLNGNGNYETGMCFSRLATGAIEYCMEGNYIK